MVPPRLTLVHSSSDDTDAASKDRASAGKNERKDERKDAAEALAELARSALVAADVVSGASSDETTAAVPSSSPADQTPPAASAGVAESAGAVTQQSAAAPPAVAPPAVAAGEAAAAQGTDAAGPAASPERAEALRIVEALLFAASEPLDERRLAEGLGKSRGGFAIGDLLADLQRDYQRRGVNLVRVAGKWAFRTAEDLSWVLERHASEERRLSKAALETLSIIAYHQPVTRAEIEDIRGVSTSAGTLDILLETGWVRPRGRRRAPGRPVTYGTTESFLNHFGLDSIKDLPGLAELKGAGLLDATLPPGFTVPEPCDVAALMPDELPLDTPDDEETQAEMELDAPDGDGEPPTE